MIVNTCGFIESAKQESIDTLLELGAEKRADQKLIATGCLVERYPRELVGRAPDGRCVRRRAQLVGAAERASPSSRSCARPAARCSLVELAPEGQLDLEMPPRRRARAERLPEDQRRLRPALRVLRHPVHEGQPSQQADRADPARDRRAASSRACARWCWSARTRRATATTWASATAWPRLLEQMTDRLPGAAAGSG